ncbi:unnamed protein product [Polarella glacialis]|uniref:Uncharacterized protein n=1 Tax=Polarella glacialis TaxID=89957 RepID=A0A813JQF4_POLGL|nr:unnamed protein product [Polarella glacialis]
MAQSMPSAEQLSRKKELNMYGKVWVTDAHVADLAVALASNDSLSFLGFRECRLVSDSGAAALASVVANVRGLSKLILEFTSVGDAGASALAGALPGSSLQRLDLGYCAQLGDPGACALAAALAQATTPLSTLVLQHCVQVTDLSAVALVQALQSNAASKLRTLGLKGTSVSASARAALEALLSQERHPPQRLALPDALRAGVTASRARHGSRASKNVEQQNSGLAAFNQRGSRTFGIGYQAAEACIHKGIGDRISRRQAADENRTRIVRTLLHTSSSGALVP